MKRKSEDVIFCALFTAVISVCAQITVPTPLFPITLQTFGIALCGYVLGTKKASLSVLVYILIGILGLPVFSGFCGGFHHLTDPAGGFVVGFLPLALFCGLSLKFNGNFKKLFIGFIGVAVMYCFGLTYFCVLTKTNILGPIALMFLFFLVKDVAVLVFAFYISEIVKKRIIKRNT